MTDKLIFLLGKKFEVNYFVNTNIIYPLEMPDGSLVYIISPKMAADYYNWLETMPLLKVLS